MRKWARTTSYHTMATARLAVMFASRVSSVACIRRATPTTIRSCFRNCGIRVKVSDVLRCKWSEDKLFGITEAPQFGLKI